MSYMNYQEALNIIKELVAELNITLSPMQKETIQHLYNFLEEEEKMTTKYTKYLADGTVYILEDDDNVEPMRLAKEEGGEVKYYYRISGPAIDKLAKLERRKCNCFGHEGEQ